MENGYKLEIQGVSKVFLTADGYKVAIDGVIISVGDLVRLIAEVMGEEVEVVQDEARMRPDASEVRRLVCDSSALRAATGWRPCVPLRQGLGVTAAWFLEPGNLARYKTTVYNV